MARFVATLNQGRGGCQDRVSGVGSRGAGAWLLLGAISSWVPSAGFFLAKPDLRRPTAVQSLQKPRQRGRSRQSCNPSWADGTAISAAPITATAAATAIRTVLRVKVISSLRNARGNMQAPGAGRRYGDPMEYMNRRPCAASERRVYRRFRNAGRFQSLLPGLYGPRKRAGRRRMDNRGRADTPSTDI